jgi:DNA-binding response OmpR family regulator
MSMAASVPVALPDAPGSGEKFRILVVEDEQNIARLVLANLTKASMECRFAPDGITGLKAFRAANPHLVLTDIMMPGMDGVELCRKIREISKVPIVIMTAKSSSEAEMEVLKAGADAFVTKPFEPQILVARVITHLRRVYQWAPPAVVVAPEPEPVPVARGSVFCEGCSHLGMVAEFEHKDSTGRSFMICPRCGSKGGFTFPIA